MSVILSLFCLENYEISQHTVTQGKIKTPVATVEPCTPSPLPPTWSLKWHTWKLDDERDIESMGCIFSLIPTTWTMQIINTKPRSLDLCAGKSGSSKILIILHYTVIFKIDLLWAILEKTSHVPYCQFKHFLYFICHKQVYFANFGMCFLSNQAHRLCCGAYFQVRVLANIDHAFISIASLFAAMKIYIFKIKVIRVKSIFIK